MIDIDVVVIGSGQAGLVIGYYLKQINQDFVILGKDARVGDSWRHRYDSLELFTPRWYSSLPGLPLEGNSGECPAKNEVADYLKYYAEYFKLPVRLKTEVTSLEKLPEGFVVKTNDGDYRAKKVIVATGPFQKPFIPSFANKLSQKVFQVHTSIYTNSSILNAGSVLVVGSGNSGAQIAVEVSKIREVYLSSGHKLKFMPLKAAGKSIFWWFQKLGLLKAPIHSKIGLFISKQGDPIFGYDLKKQIQTGKIITYPRLSDIKDDTFFFEDGRNLEASNVIWATGFRPGFEWISMPGSLNPDTGRPIHVRGVSDIAGLFFLGLPWQHRRGSALIGGVADDAKYISELIQNG